MRTYPLLMISAAFVVSNVAGCAQLPSTKSASCEVGQTCTLSGRLEIHRGAPASAALLVFDDGCAKLALPESFYEEESGWNRRKVTVVGRAFEQPSFDSSEGQIALWYSEEDRKIALGMCDGGLGIYVASMKASSGSAWP